MQEKNDAWIWITVDRHGKKLLHFIVGDRSGNKLWSGIKNREIKTIAIGYWKAYDQTIPEETPIRSKSETFTLEVTTVFSVIFLPE